MKVNKTLAVLFFMPFFSHATDSLDYCRDLMSKVRDTYGKAPLCMPVIDKNGNDMTTLSGLVGLSDDMTPSHSYFYMTIQPSQLNDQYSYNENELSQLISLMKLQGKGVTKKQGAIINLDNSIQNLTNSFSKGLIDKKFYDNAVSNLEKAKKQFQDN